MQFHKISKYLLFGAGLKKSVQHQQQQIIPHFRSFCSLALDFTVLALNELPFFTSKHSIRIWKKGCLFKLKLHASL